MTSAAELSDLILSAAIKIPIRNHKCRASSNEPVNPCKTKAVRNPIANAYLKGSSFAIAKLSVIKWIVTATNAVSPRMPVCAATLRNEL